jgi:hypothetical protein
MTSASRETILRRRINLLTWFFIAGLVVSGVTAIPLESEVNWLVQTTGARQLVESPAGTSAPAWAHWLVKVQTALHDVAAQHSFLFYGTDWLAFGHFIIALVFVGALKDPVRNRWLFNFGLIACVLVVPYAFIFGAVRGIPFWWRLIDCSFGIVGFAPLWLCRQWSAELDQPNAAGHR